MLIFADDQTLIFNYENQFQLAPYVLSNSVVDLELTSKNINPIFEGKLRILWKLVSICTPWSTYKKISHLIYFCVIWLTTAKRSSVKNLENENDAWNHKTHTKKIILDKKNGKHI